MRTWLLTNTTYGSWLPGDARGSIASVRDLRIDDPRTLVRIEHDIPGEPYEEAIPGLEEASRELLKGPPIFLTREHAEILAEQFRETATYRGWVLRAVAIMFNHYHLVVQVTGDPEPSKILNDFKAYASRSLNRHFGKPVARWWTSGGSKRKLKDDDAVAAGIHYVLKKQTNPLVLWSPDIGEPDYGEPGA